MTLKDYTDIVGESVIDGLRFLAERLKGKVIQNINSTSVGGGVAEILHRMVPLLKELGVDARWDVIKGGEQFFQVTKKIHNLLHGRKDQIDAHDFEIFMENSRENIANLDTYGDIVFVHDPQPIALVKKKTGNKWVWRCHVDVSKPDKQVWSFLKRFILKYDASVFSAPSFAQTLPIPQYLISPSIDPLSEKNKPLEPDTIKDVFERYDIDMKRPVITQISRFDYLKDPVGVIAAYRLVKKYNDCQLVLAGGTATDDPESSRVLEEVKEAAAADSDIRVLMLPPSSDLEINALQRGSTIVIQKSIKEGFGLTVSEALWKGKPIVASAVGGIPLQIKHKYSGLLCHSVEGVAYSLKQLLNSPSYARRLGENGYQHIKQNFLLTRHLRDYMLVFLSLYHPQDIINL